MMGMYDEVFFNVDLPGFPVAGHLFHTKSLDPCMDRYTVTKAGRLCLVGSVMIEDGPFVTAPAELEKLDIGFHGDILLRSLERESSDYVARFTDGTLQWVRPLIIPPVAELPRSQLETIMLRRQKEKG